jgi:DNA helicase-2/ATP-dependent DNA helicase PcrA
MDKVDEYALKNNISFYEALKRAEYIPSLGRAASKITSFVSLIEVLKSKLSDPKYSLLDLMEEILEATGYIEELESQDPEDAEDRIENIGELKSKIATYEENAIDEPTLSGFLEEVALVADIDNLNEDSNMVVLMTLHSAKGLEFPYVYLCGMEEGIFPGYMSIRAANPEEEIEEERRLCYVGITRAMKYLSLSAARQRMLRGETQFNKPSRFINEIPRYLLKMSAPPQKKLQSGFRDSDTKYDGVSSLNKAFDFEKTSDKGKYMQSQLSYKPYAASESKQIAGSNMGSLDYGVGDTVKHIKFGIGIVTDITKGGKDYEITVDFPNFGTKKLLSSFANLIRVN